MTTEMKCLAGNEPRIIVTDAFIQSNSLAIIPEEEIKRLREDDADFFGFAQEVYCDFLPWELVKSDYKEEYVFKVESGEEEKPHQVTDIKEAAQDFLDYMVFAWMKAEDERGISANRSIIKLAAWLRVMGRADLAELITSEGLYNPYGAPALVAVCREMGIETPDSIVIFAGN